MMFKIATFLAFALTFTCPAAEAADAVAAPGGKAETSPCQSPVWTSLDVLQGLEETKKLRSEVNDLKKNLLPIGFIYTQLPGQPTPQELWSGLQIKWENISPSLEGVFLRAEGGSAAVFGTTQNATSPRIIEARVEDIGAGSIIYNAKIKDGTWSEKLYHATVYNSISHTYQYGLQFLHSGEENKPKNTAVRFWKRVA